jgi:hypothetical protein
VKKNDQALIVRIALAIWLLGLGFERARLIASQAPLVTILFFPLIIIGFSFIISEFLKAYNKSLYDHLKHPGDISIRRKTFSTDFRVLILLIVVMVVQFLYLVF